MKYLESLRLASALAIMATSPIAAQQTIFLGSATCRNGDTEECTVCNGKEIITYVWKKGDFVGDPKECTPSGSYVENGSWRYAMSTMDYAFNSSGGCAPCGSSISSGYNNLPSLELQRNTYISVTEVFSSFGTRSGFAKYDDVLVFENRSNTMTLRSPGEQTIQGSLMEFNPATDMWERITSVGKNFVGVSLYRENGSLITRAGQRDEAATAILLDHDGSTRHFELIRNRSRGGVARLVALMDRYGNQETIGYTSRRPRGTVRTLANYFRKQSITDAYGRKATFTTQRIAGTNVITSATLPSGERITYSYQNSGVLGNPFIKSVTRENGSVSTYSNETNLDTLQNELSIYEAYSDGSKRRKKISMQGTAGFTSTGQLIDLLPRLTRQVTNGDGEVRFANRIAAGNDLVFTYQGGNRSIATSISGDTNGYAGGGFLTKPLKFDAFMTEDVTQVVRDGEYTQANNGRRMSETKGDPLGRSLNHVRDVITQSPTSGIHIDGYVATQTYDQFDQPELGVDTLGRQVLNVYNEQNGVKESSTRGFQSEDETTMTYVYNSRGQMIQSRDALYDTELPELHNTIYVYDNAEDYANPVDELGNPIYSQETLDKIREMLTGEDTLYFIGKIEAADAVGLERPVTTYVNNELGLVDSIITPASSETNEDEGRTTKFEYDFYNRIVKTTFSDSSTEETIYGEPGSKRENLVVEMINRNGISTIYEYDESDRRIKTVVAPDSPEVSIEEYTYLEGTLLRETYTLNGDTRTYLFDQRNRVIGMQTQADAETVLTTEIEYDAVSRRRSMRDAYGRKTFYLYDQNDRIIKTVRETFPGSLEGVPSIDLEAQQTVEQKLFSFTDRDGNTLITEGTHQVTYTCPRDIFLNELERSDDNNALFVITECIYDSEAQKVVTVDGNGNISFIEYDELGRQKLSIYALGSDEEVRNEAIYDDNSNVIESRGPRFFSETNADGTPFADVNNYTYNGRNLRQTQTTATGSDVEATQSWTYYLDGRSNQTFDFRGNFTRSLWHLCCGRFQASIQRDGTSADISNTDFYGNITHTAAVKDFDLNTEDFHNPIDVDTLEESTTRYDGRNRPTFMTSWLTPLGKVNDEARPNLGNGDIPIADIVSSRSGDIIINVTNDSAFDESTFQGLTTAYEYDRGRWLCDESDQFRRRGDS